jgi:hypothetical protein
METVLERGCKGSLESTSWMTVENSKLAFHDDLFPERMPEGVGSRSTTPPVTRRPVEQLNTLSRDHNLEHGRTILLLQSMQLFDVFFWPVESSIVLRNVEMLKYHKQSKKMATHKSSQYMTLLVSMLRASVSMLDKFFPFGELAELNYKRIIALIHASQDVYPLKGPMGVDEWFVIVFAYVCKNIAVIREALSPVFLHLCMDTSHPVQDHNFEAKYHTAQKEIDEEAYSRIQHDKSLTLYVEVGIEIKSTDSVFAI